MGGFGSGKSVQKVTCKSKPHLKQIMPLSGVLSISLAMVQTGRGLGEH